MSYKPVVVLGVVSGVALAAGLLAVAASGEGADPSLTANTKDVEALARMIASENPTGSLRLWVQQCWTQIRSRKRGQSVYDRITGGRGFGPQNKQRPVATTESASAEHRTVARLVLLGAELATWVSARKFFEPDQQDLMYRIGERARAKRSRGEALTAQEERALGYEHDAEGIRRKWSQEGSKRQGEIDGVEFWT